MSITELELPIIGQDGNAFAIMGAAGRVLKDAGLYEEYWSAYYAEATAGDYDHLLRTTMEYFEVV